jgi:serine phosphatase RsbU (regulator of sigma subunit)
MALCTIDKATKTVEYAGARNPLIYIKNGELFHIKADKQGIGGKKTSLEQSFTNHVISYADTETYFYIFSDGFQDQFGGPKNRKFMIKRMKELFLEHHQKPMNEQEKIYNYTIENWMKDVEQTDDIIVIGFALGPED